MAAWLDGLCMDMARLGQPLCGRALLLLAWHQGSCAAVLLCMGCSVCLCGLPLARHVHYTSCCLYRHLRRWALLYWLVPLPGWWCCQHS